MSPMTPAALPGRVDQIAVVVPDLEAAMDGYIASLGVRFGVFEATETTISFSGSSERFRLRITPFVIQRLGEMVHGA